MAEKREKRKKRKPGGGGKRPAHEVITHQMRTWFTKKDVDDGGYAAIAALGEVLNNMIIPKDEIPKIKDELLDVLTAGTPRTEENLEALQKVVQGFRKEYPG